MTAVLAAATAPASAQGYEGWIMHPYPNAGYGWCGWVQDGGPHDGWTYWCWSPSVEQWFPANPDWYDQAAAEMERRAASVE